MSKELLDKYGDYLDKSEILEFCEDLDVYLAKALKEHRDIIDRIEKAVVSKEPLEFKQQAVLSILNRYRLKKII